MYKFLLSHTYNSICGDLFKISTRLLHSDNYSKYITILLFLNVYSTALLCDEICKLLVYVLETFMRCKYDILLTTGLNVLCVTVFLYIFEKRLDKKSVDEIDNDDKVDLFSYEKNDTDDNDDIISYIKNDTDYNDDIKLFNLQF